MASDGPFALPEACSISRFRQKDMTLAPSPPVRVSFTRVSAKAFLAWGVSYAKHSPRFRRLALWMLNRMPALAIRLRQMHLGSQPTASWSENQMQVGAGITANSAGSLPKGQQPQHRSDGINARQRSPLEAHFHTYVGRG
jgi:hypothetical protein